jgi:sugar O-acyltransferase (sialic acid O-acetyltransferase NeuD family)
MNPYTTNPISQPLHTKPHILLIGGGGHCRSVIDVIEQEGIFEIGGIIEAKEDLKGKKILAYKVIGTDDDLEKLREKYEYAIVTVGQIKTADIRIKLFNKLKRLDFNIPVIISPNAYVSRYSSISEGTVIMHNVVVNAGVKIGKNCIINSKALIEHDVIIEDHCHVSTGVNINGGVIVRNRSFIGSGSVIRENIEIKEKSFIKMGSLIK